MIRFLNLTINDGGDTGLRYLFNVAHVMAITTSGDGERANLAMSSGEWVEVRETLSEVVAQVMALIGEPPP